MTRVDAPVKTAIPDKHMELCKAIGRLCREAGLLQFSGTYRPTHNDPWDGDIRFSWAQGRHGEDSDKISIVASRPTSPRNRQPTMRPIWQAD